VRDDVVQIAGHPQPFLADPPQYLLLAAMGERDRPLSTQPDQLGHGKQRSKSRTEREREDRRRGAVQVTVDHTGPPQFGDVADHQERDCRGPPAQVDRSPERDDHRRPDHAPGVTGQLIRERQHVGGA